MWHTVAVERPESSVATFNPLDSVVTRVSGTLYKDWDEKVTGVKNLDLYRTCCWISSPPDKTERCLGAFCTSGGRRFPENWPKKWNSTWTSLGNRIWSLLTVRNPNGLQKHPTFGILASALLSAVPFLAPSRKAMADAMLESGRRDLRREEWALALMRARVILETYADLRALHARRNPANSLTVSCDFTPKTSEVTYSIFSATPSK